MAREAPSPPAASRLWRSGSGRTRRAARPAQARLGGLSDARSRRLGQSTPSTRRGRPRPRRSPLPRHPRQGAPDRPPAARATVRPLGASDRAIAPTEGRGELIAGQMVVMSMIQAVVPLGRTQQAVEAPCSRSPGWRRGPAETTQLSGLCAEGLIVGGAVRAGLVQHTHQQHHSSDDLGDPGPSAPSDRRYPEPHSQQP